MQKYILKSLMVIVLLAVSQIAFAQYDYDDDDLKRPKKPKEETSTKDDSKNTIKKDKKFDVTKLSFGGYLGAQFGTITRVDISPILAYRVVDRLTVGVGLIYQYVNYGNYYPPPIDKAHTYGGRIFPRVFIWESLFAQVEYMILNAEVYDFGGNFPIEFRETFHNVFLGAGYNIPIGGNSYLTILLSVNLTENLYYPTRRVIYSFGFGIGL